MSVFDKVKEVIIDKLGVDEDSIKTEAHFVNDLGADSLDTVELIMELEEEFGIEIPDEKAETITTVGAAVEYIEKIINNNYLNEKGQSSYNWDWCFSTQWQ